MAFVATRSCSPSKYNDSSHLYTGDFSGNLQGTEFTEYLHRQEMQRSEAHSRSRSMSWADGSPRAVFRAVARRKTVASASQPSKSPCAKHALALGQQRCSEQARARLILNCSPEDFRNFKESLKSTGVLTSMGASQVLHSPLQCHILANSFRPRDRLADQKAAFSAAA